MSGRGKEPGCCFKIETSARRRDNKPQAEEVVMSNVGGTSLHEIKILVLSHQPLIVFETVEEERVDRLLESVAEELKLPLFEWTVTRGLRRKDSASAFHGTQEPMGVLKYIGGLTVEAMFHLKDFEEALHQLPVRRQFKELLASFAAGRSTIILTSTQVDLPPDLAGWAVRHRLCFPDDEELRATVREVLRTCENDRPVDLELGPDDVEYLLRALRGLTLKQARQILSYSILLDGKLSRDDIPRIAEKKGELIAEQGLLELYPVAGNHYELGGFRNLRVWLERAWLGFSREAGRYGLQPPRGILLVGVQGCGKSLAAKVVARLWKLPLLKLDATRLYDKYVGESERNFRQAASQAEALAPVVLWIDELEKVFATGSSDADSGLSRRILGFFLTWLQEKKEGVFVVATANDVQALPPELLRKGRFDEIFFVDLPDAEEREDIWAIHLRLRHHEPKHFDLAALSQASEGFSGAEIEQATITALYEALQTGKQLTTDLLVRRLGETIPLSVSRREEIESFRAWVRPRFVPAG